MRIFFHTISTGLWCAALLAGAVGRLSATQPVITSATSIDVDYDAQNSGDVQFAYRIEATGAPTTFDAVGLPPTASLNSATGWINGLRNAPGVYNVAIRAINADGAGAATLRIAVHPAAVGVTSSQGVFHAGQSFSFHVHYNATMTVSGAPHLSVALGSSDAVNIKDATYVSGSGTDDLVFQYTVAPGDADSDGVQLLPSAPVGGTISDVNGLVASASLPVRYFVSGITIAADAGVTSTPSSAPQASVGTAGRLVNVSSRMRVIAGDSSRSLIAGFVVSGTQSRRVLLRAIGPALGAFGVTGPLADPRLQVYSSAGRLVVENDNWSGVETRAAASATGAFSLADGTRDAAVVTSLAPGAYTLVVASNGGDGDALAEVYDADDAAAGDAPGIINLSTRGYVGGDAGALIAGFAVRGDAPRRVLVRGVGPGLTAFGVPGALADPALTIYQDGRVVAQNDDWGQAGPDVGAATTASGAFALTNGSKDAAMVLTLPPGAYSAVLSGAGGASGAALVEVYELP